VPDDRPAEARPPDAVPGDAPQPSNQPVDDMVASEPLDLSDDDGDDVVEQQNVGSERSLGGGEWPDPEAPPSDAAAGSAGLAPPRSRGQAQFKDAQERAR
jgi:hypothetical protein